MGHGLLPVTPPSAKTRTPPQKTGEGMTRCALRLGFRQVTGLAEDDMKRMVERRTIEGREVPYRDPADLWRRGGLTSTSCSRASRTS